jgi:5'(3')-deoxyribonucleotidase
MYFAKRIAIDMDEVLFPMIKPLARHYISKHKKAIPAKLPKVYDYCKYFNLSETESKLLVESFYYSHQSTTVTPLQHSVNAMQTLAQDNLLYVVTGRQTYKQCINVTHHLLNKHFNGIFDDVYFTNSYSLYGSEIPKSEICEKLGIDMLVDDSVYNCVQSQENSNIKSIVFGEYPWNEDTAITRIKSWELENLKYL